MKTFSFMKKALFVALTMVSVVACDENESDGGMQTPFPEQKVEALQAGSETNLTFNASSAWVLESNQLWCKFSNNMTTMSGEAGEQNVTVNITDELQGTASDTADVKLTMSGETKVVLRVIRMGQALSIVDQDGVAYDDEHPVAIVYTNNGAKAMFTFKGNFNWELKESPEWLEVVEGLPIRSNANTEVQMTLEVVKSYWANALNDTLKFYMQNTDTYVKVPVSFNGLPDGVVVSDGIDGSAFWWTVAGDGQSYWKEGSMVDGGVGATSFPLNFKVLAKDNQYKVLRVEQNDNWMNVIEDDYSSFVSLSDDGQGNVTIDFFKENSGSERTAYILAMPKTVYDEASQQAQDKGDSYDGIILTDDGSDLNTNYDKYVVLACKQEAAGTAAAGFEVLYQGWQSMTCEQGDGGTGLMEPIVGNFSVDESQVYIVNVTAGSRLTINPMLTVDVWDGSDLANVPGMTFEGEELNKDTWESGLTTDESGFTLSLTADQSMILVFRGTDTLNKKALIINVQ